MQGGNYGRNFAQILRALDAYPTSAAERRIPNVTSAGPAFTRSKSLTRLLAVFGVGFVVIGLAIVSPFLVQWFRPPPPPTDPATVRIGGDPEDTIPLTAPPVTADVTAGPVLSSEFWITYNSDINGNRDLFILNPATGEERSVITDPSHDKVGTWSPDGEFLAFESNRGTTFFYHIYLYDSQLGQITRLTEAAECSNWSPAWSPDGKRIVFYSNCEGDQRDIYLMNRDGSGRRRLTTGSSQDQFPAFSPDGNSITFTSTRSGREQIFLMNADGSDQRALADGCSSTFSPDGEWIWFSTRCGDSDIQRIRTDGTGLSTIGSRCGQNPSVSPDGQFVVFQSNEDIWIMRIDGSDPTRLTSSGAFDGAPSWGP